MTIINNILFRIRNFSQQSVNSFGAQYDAFSVFIFIFYLANPLKWNFSDLYPFSIFAVLRILAVLLWFPLCLWRWWPNTLKPYLPLFWHFALFYHLPFRTTISVLHTPHLPSFDSSGLLGIIALAVLVDEKIFILLTSLGILFGTAFYLMGDGLTTHPLQYATLFYACTMVISIAFVKLVFFRNYNIWLKEKVKANMILASAIAHEVSGPICTINVACENGDLVLAKAQASKALNIVESILLQTSYLEKNRTSTIVKVSLAELILSLCHSVYFMAVKQQKIKLDVADDLYIFADPILLSQVFSNLIKNALWAIHGRDHGQIVISAIKKQDFVNAIVSDNGRGIDEKLRKKIFEPFHSFNKNGAGIGLAFCRLALENMSATIQCESIKNEGTRFVISLPRAHETSSTIPNRSPEKIYAPFE